MFSHLQESRAPSHITVTWKDKRQNSEHPLSSFFPQLLLLSKTWYTVGYPFGLLRSAVLAVSTPNSLCTAILLTGGAEWDTEKSLTLCRCSWAHWCVIGTVLVANPKHPTRQTTVKEINSVTAKPVHSVNTVPFWIKIIRWSLLPHFCMCILKL